jgi:exonuclease III
MGGRLRKDGQPDMRYKSNRESASSNYVARKSAVTTGTFHSSDNDSYDWNAPGPLRKDGQPNMRYAVNKKYVAEKEANKVAENDRYDRNASGPLRKDGHPDMRYAVNKNYVSENNVKIQEKIPATITKPTNSSVPLRKDGQPDMRFTCNKEEKKLNPPGPLRADGQPDMRIAANKKYVAERETSKVAEKKKTPDWNAPGPLRKDGQPDMHYAVNKKYVAEREANKVAENKKTAEEVNKMEAVVKGKVKFGHVNAQSLLKKGEKLEQLIAQSKLNVLAVTETWFENDSDLNDKCPKGFQALHRPRRGRRGGGVAIFCRDNIDITRNYHKSYNSFEYLDVSIAIGSSEKIRIVTIYRPSGNSSSRDEFLQEFESMLESSNGDKRIFTGDFNLHVENPDKNDRAFLDLIKSHGLVQHVKESTHKKEGILDLILSRPSDRLVKNVRVGNDFSDHKSVECTISIEMEKEEIIQREE